MRFAYFEDQGRVSLSINDSTLAELPVGAFALTAKQWDQRFDLALIDGALIESPRPSLGHQWTDNEWQQYAEAIHAEKVSAINSASEAAITGGFWSLALGERHQYGSQLEDQLNLTGSILHGTDTPYACRDAQGIKEFRPHTAGQLRQVGDDFTLYKLQLLQKANRLKQQLDQALASHDVAAIEAVVWESAA